MPMLAYTLVAPVCQIAALWSCIVDCYQYEKQCNAIHKQYKNCRVRSGSIELYSCWRSKDLCKDLRSAPMIHAETRAQGNGLQGLR